jgi:hypothetical protein
LAPADWEGRWLQLKDAFPSAHALKLWVQDRTEIAQRLMEMKRMATENLNAKRGRGRPAKNSANSIPRLKRSSIFRRGIRNDVFNWDTSPSAEAHEGAFTSAPSGAAQTTTAGHYTLTPVPGESWRFRQVQVVLDRAGKRPLSTAALIRADWVVDDALIEKLWPAAAGVTGWTLVAEGPLLSSHRPEAPAAQIVDNGTGLLTNPRWIHMPEGVEKELAGEKYFKTTQRFFAHAEWGIHSLLDDMGLRSEYKRYCARTKNKPRADVTPELRIFLFLMEIICTGYGVEGLEILETAILARQMDLPYPEGAAQLANLKRIKPADEVA